MIESGEEKELAIPVFIPKEDGTAAVMVGNGRLLKGRLVIDFKSSLPGVAIQRMLARDELMGLSFVMLGDRKDGATGEEKVDERRVANAALREAGKSKAP